MKILSMPGNINQLLLRRILKFDPHSQLAFSLSSSKGPIKNQYYENKNKATADKPKWDELDTSFSDYEATFKSKTTGEILRGYIVYQLCSSSYIVDNNIKVIDM